VAGRQVRGKPPDRQGLLLVEDTSSHCGGQDVEEFASPEGWQPPIGIALADPTSGSRPLTLDEQIADEVRVSNDHFETKGRELR